MVVMAPRENWTDARLDDLAKHMDARFDHVDARFSDLTRLMQMGLVIIGAILTLIAGMLAGLITLIVAQL